MARTEDEGNGRAVAAVAVGLVFAGRANDASYMLPLGPILERFGVSLVSGHGSS